MINSTRYTAADWEGVQDDIETTFERMRRELANSDLMMVRRAQAACRSAIERAVSVASVLGHDFDGLAEFSALQTMASSFGRAAA